MSTPSSVGRVHASVAAGQSAEEVRRAIDACAPPGDEQGRAAAVNESGGGEKNEETALQAAHRLRRGDLIGLMLEEGANAMEVCSGYGYPTTALALCICYDLPETLRALLREGHDANQRLQYDARDLPDACSHNFTLLHVCVNPPKLPASDALRPSPRLACLEALVREGGADVDGRDACGTTPLHWAADRTDIDGAEVVDLHVRLGADVNARDEHEQTPIFRCACSGDAAVVRRLLAHGASPDVADDKGYTPLMEACSKVGGSNERDVALQLARHSSPQTRRTVVASPGSELDRFSAADFSVSFIIAWEQIAMEFFWENDSIAEPIAELIAELLAYGAPVLPRHAAIVLPIAVSHGLPLAAQKEAELSRRLDELCSWRGHEAFAGLAMDVGELRAAESEVEAKRQRLLELEMELLALGAGTVSSSSSGSGSGSGSSSDEEDGSESGSDEDDESSSGSDEDDEDGDDEDDERGDESKSGSDEEDGSGSEVESDDGECASGSASDDGTDKKQAMAA